MRLWGERSAYDTSEILARLGLKSGLKRNGTKEVYANYPTRTSGRG
jgi:hypothetical protein